MGYSSGLLRQRVRVLVPERVGGHTEWIIGPLLWASVTWSKGARALMHGEVAVYDTVLVRTRWNAILTNRCRIQWGDRVFIIDSLNADRQENIMQMVCHDATAGTMRRE